MATGGADYYPDRHWYEDVLCLYEYQTKKGSARAFYQVINTNGFLGYYEKFSGDEGTIMISENPITALSGVRSSWLIMARNSDLARSAASA